MEAMEEGKEGKEAMEEGKEGRKEGRHPLQRQAQHLRGKAQRPPP